MVNALWAGGAEAMMLQDQRVISTSAVRCVGNTLLLQGRVYSPPYVITAVGDVKRMRQKLDADPSVTIYRQYADLLGLRYDVEDKARLTLPAYAGSLDLVHARAGGEPYGALLRGDRGGRPALRWPASPSDAHPLDPVRPA